MKIDNIQQRFNNVAVSKTFKIIRDFFKLETKKVLDLGCGYGEYLSLYGRGSLGITTTLSEVEFAQLKGLNVILGNVEELETLKIKQIFDVIWANNLFEHILSPHPFLIKLKTISDSETTLILGVPVIPKINFLLKFKKFRGSLAINHINFFTKKSLELTVERAGWKVKESKSFVFKNNFLDRIFTSIFSPHIYIVAKNIQDFKYSEKKLKEWEGFLYYKGLLDIVSK